MTRSYKNNPARYFDGSRNRKRWPAYKRYREHAKRTHNRSCLALNHLAWGEDTVAHNQWETYAFGYGFRDIDRGGGYYRPQGRYPTREDWNALPDNKDEDLSPHELYAKIVRESGYHPDEPDWCYWEYIRK